MMKIFKSALNLGKFDRDLGNGEELVFTSIYPVDACFDVKEDVPTSILEHKRYKDYSNYTISEVAALIEKEHGPIDFLVHSLANAPEIKKPLLETSRDGYLEAISSSSYSFVSMVKHFAPIMKSQGSFINLSYIASQKIIPGYGGGMSSAKAALESDTKTLAFEVGTKYGLRVNSISAGTLSSRAARAIGMIETMIEHSMNNAPLPQALSAQDVAKTAAFLLSSDAKAITASTIYVDNGVHALGSFPAKKQDLSTSFTS